MPPRKSALARKRERETRAEKFRTKPDSVSVSAPISSLLVDDGDLSLSPTRESEPSPTPESEPSPTLQETGRVTRVTRRAREFLETELLEEEENQDLEIEDQDLEFEMAAEMALEVEMKMAERLAQEKAIPLS